MYPGCMTNLVINTSWLHLHIRGFTHERNYFKPGSQYDTNVDANADVDADAEIE